MNPSIQLNVTLYHYGQLDDFCFNNNQDLKPQSRPVCEALEALEVAITMGDNISSK